MENAASDERPTNFSDEPKILPWLGPSRRQEQSEKRPWKAEPVDLSRCGEVGEIERIAP